MAIKTGDNFLYRGKKPLDSRDSFDTILAMTTFAESSIDEGHISYVKETDKYYKFNSTNTVDMTLGKWREYNGGGGSSTDEKVKLDATATDAKYLNELIDNATIEVDTTNNCLVVKKIDGQTATVAEINFLTGVKSNIQTQIDNLGKSMTMYGVFGTKADLLASTTPTPVDGNTAIVIADEDNSNKQMTYIYIASNSAWTQVAESSVTVRDFTTEPINLATETTGTLHKSKIDTAIARLADVLDKATYKGTGDGIVKQADKLTGLTATIAALNQAVTDSHTHSNKAVLDKIVSNGIGSGFLADNGKYISILHIGTTSPTYDSQIWIDNTDSSKPILKIFDGTNWIAISSASSGSGTSITVDSAMSDTSTNPVQNKVIKKYIDDKEINVSAEVDNAIEEKDDGLYVENKTEEINSINEKLNKIKKYQKYVNTDLDYIYVSIQGTHANEVLSEKGDRIPFDKVICSNNISINNDYSIPLKAGKTYEISADFWSGISPNSGIRLDINDITNNINISRFHKSNGTPSVGIGGTDFKSAYNNNGEVIYTPTTDCDIAVIVSDFTSGGVKIPGQVDNLITNYLFVKEVGRAITIDPLEYVNTTQGIEDTPVGNIITCTAINAPNHYLLCDGTEYNISDYPYLTQHFLNEFGVVNYYGGDGINTFAIPAFDNKISKVRQNVAMVTSNTNNYVVTASSYYSNGYAPWMAFSGSNSSNFWSTSSHANGSSHWLKIDFKENILFNQIVQLCQTDEPSNGIAKFEVLISNDDINYKSVAVNNDVGNINRIIDLNKIYNARYVKFDIVQSAPSYVSIRDISLNLILIQQNSFIKYEPTYFMKNIYSGDSVNYTDEEIREAVSAVLGGTK